MAAVPFVPGCGETTETNLAPPAAITEVKLLAQSWGTSQVNAKIAELLLREQLGVTARTIQAAEAGIWTQLADGSAHACLEVWPLRNGDGMRTYADTGRVSTFGELGVGRTAWFVPSYVVDAVPEISTPTVASALAGVLQKARISQLIVGPNDWITPSPARLGALGVSTLAVQQAGTEKALLDQVRAAYESRTPFMASLWYPHPVHALYGLRAVGLPAAAGCDVNATPFGCDYPAEKIVKVGFPGLKFSNPDVIAFFEAFAPPVDDIVALLTAAEGTPEVVARDWIKARAVVWNPWITAARGAKKA